MGFGYFGARSKVLFLDDYDCLVDVLQLHLEDVQLYQGVRLPDEDDESYPGGATPTATVFAKGKKAAAEFKDYTILVDVSG